MKKTKVKVRMAVSIGGHAAPPYDLDEFSFSPGQVVELHPDLAQAWIACGHANPIDEAVDSKVKIPAAETASFQPSEKAVMPEPVVKKR